MEEVKNNKDFRKLGDMVARLRKEQARYGRLTIAVDFDDTLCHYNTDNVVPVAQRPENEDICNLIRAIGDRAYIILWTCRTGDMLAEALEWINAHKIPIHSIADNPFANYGGKKIHANIFLDDRAGLRQAYQALNIIYEVE